MSSFQSLTGTGDYLLLQMLLPKTFSLPPSLLTATPEDMETFFHLTAQTLQHHQQTIQNSLTDDIFKERKQHLETEHLQELSRFRKEMEAEHLKEIQGLRKTLLELENASRDEKRNLETAYEKQMKSLRMETAELQASLTAARTSFDALQKQVQERVFAATEEAARSRQELLETTERHHAEKLEVLERKNQEILAAKDSLLADRETRLREAEEKIREKLAVQNNSSRKGGSGETEFLALAEQYTNWKMTYTGKKDHSCDYISNIHQISAFFEVKNYTNDVPSKEVSKFLRDLKEHPEIQVGVFVSLHTGITGKHQEENGKFVIEWTNQHQLTVYIGHFMSLDLSMVFSFLDEIIKVSSIFHHQIREQTRDEAQRVGILETRIDNTKRYLENAILRMKNMTYRFGQDKKQAIERIQDNYDYYMREVKQQTEEIGTMIQMLLGVSVEEEEAPSETPQVLPVAFKKGKTTKKKST